MFISLFFTNYILLCLFLEEYYVIYFLSFLFLSFIYMKYMHLENKLTLSFYSTLIIVSPFLFEYFDTTIFDIYLFLDLNELYRFVGGEVSYFLSVLHSFIFFLGYNRKLKL